MVLPIRRLVGVREEENRHGNIWHNLTRNNEVGDGALLRPQNCQQPSCWICLEIVHLFHHVEYNVTATLGATNNISCLKAANNSASCCKITTCDLPHVLIHSP